MNARPWNEGRPDAGILAAPGWLLAPLGWLYGALVTGRRAAYRLGLLRTHRGACPVVSVGNLTVGGSGKTPVADWLLRAAATRGVRPACLSRGYRRSGRSDLVRVRCAEGVRAAPRSLGDEPALLARRNPEVPLYVGANRVAAARLAAAWDAPDLLVLDDGYQHLRLHRDLNLLLVDAARGLGNGRLLPAGPLREPLGAARRADAVLITGATSPEEADAEATAAVEGLSARLRGVLRPGVPVFSAAYRPARLRRLDGGATLPPEALRGRSLGLVCAIARPEAFVHTVEALGARVQTVQAYRDHHAYGPAEREALERALAAAETEPPAWLTTEKDAVKLDEGLAHGERLWALEMEVAPEPAFRAFFFDFLKKCGLE